MENLSSYVIAWMIYLVAGLVFLRIFWTFSAALPRWLAYSLRAFLAALMFTPWYANSQGGYFAPALMVAMMDAITVGPQAAIRAFVPLFLALIAALLIVVITLIIKKKTS